MNFKNRREGCIKLVWIDLSYFGTVLLNYDARYYRNIRLSICYIFNDKFFINKLMWRMADLAYQ